MRRYLHLFALSAMAVGFLAPINGTLAAAQSSVHPLTTAPPPVDESFGSNAPFGNLLVGQSMVGQFLFGTLTVPIQVTGASLTGPNPASFSIVKNTCTGGIVLQGSTRCEVDVQFTPHAAAFVDESIELATTSGPFAEDIGAYGLVAPLLISPTAVDFGFQPIGTQAVRTVTLTNPNPIPLSYDYTYYGLAATNFAIGTTTCGTIAANSSCTYQIIFLPSTTGSAGGYWSVVNGEDETRSFYHSTQVRLSGVGISDGVTSADLSKSYNIDGIGFDSGHVLGGGLDGLGNVYASELLANPLFASGQTFVLGKGDALDAVTGMLIPVTPGHYYGISLLGTAIRGNQQAQPFVINYADGSSITERQSLSDWRTPQKYSGESIAATTAYRLSADGVRSTKGPYYLYAYTFPVDHSKQVVSVKLPGSHSVAVLAMNLHLIGVPATADLAPLYNVPAIKEPQQVPTTDGGIDGLNNAVDINEIFASASFEASLRSVPDYKANSVANVTVPLPGGTYSSLRLFGSAVRGNYANRTLTINYKDGTSTILHQSFSDWHTSQGYAGESIALAMSHRLTASGGVQAGTYNIYRYDIPIDAGKPVESLVLPNTRNVVIMQVTLEP
jgi:hypothetical protein